MSKGAWIVSGISPLLTPKHSYIAYISVENLDIFRIAYIKHTQPCQTIFNNNNKQQDSHPLLSQLTTEYND